MIPKNPEIKNVRKIRVAAVQMPSENGRITANLAHATLMIERAAKEGAQLVLLPEFMPTGYFLGEDIWNAAETASGPTVKWLKESSKRLGIWLGTSFLETDGRDFFNTFVLTDPLGEETGRVRKQTPAMWEAYFFKGESGSHAIETRIGKIGVAICLDIHIADVAAALSKGSVNLVLGPQSQPVLAGSSGMFTRETRIEHLEMIAPLIATLLGVPVVTANKCGPWISTVPGPQIMKTVGASFPGRSTIVDSDGSVKERLGEEEGVVVADVVLDPARKKHPNPPRYGRYVHPGPPQRAILRLIEGVGRLSYTLSSKRKNKARTAVSKA